MNALGQLFEASFTSRLCLTLLHSLWQIGLVAVALWVIERFASTRSVEVRYKVHVAALLLAIAAVPLTFLLLEGSQEPAVRSVATVLAAESEFDVQPVAPNSGPPLGQVIGQQAALRSTVSARQANGSAAALPASITRWIAAVYALGVLLMLARLLRGMWLGQRMVSRARFLTDGPLVAATRRLAERWKLASLPRLALSDALAMPCVTGLLRPTIVFPVAVLSGMSPAEIELILVHELAHVRRHDLWIHLLQRVAEAGLFFNPGLWYLSRRLSVLREYCCDELACGVPASSTEATRLQYAAALVHSAELQLATTGRFSASSLPEIGALAAAGSSPSELRRRVARILDEPLREPMLLSRGGVAAFLALIAASVLAPAAVYSGSQDPDAGVSKQQPGSSENRRIAEPEVTTAQPNPFTRTLKSGAEIKVLGIGTRNETPERWWRPDGNPFEGVPYHVKDNERYTFPGPVTREAVFAVENVPEDASFRIETNPPADHWGSGGVADADSNRLAHHYGRIFSLGRDVRTFELKVGVASGAWETIATCQPNRQSPVASNGVIFSGPFTSGLGRLQIVTVSHELHDQDTRLVVVVKKGKPYPVENWYRESSGKNVRVAQFEFPYHVEQIDHFEFQARAFEWATFENLPVEPKPDKGAKATVSGRILAAGDGNTGDSPITTGVFGIVSEGTRFVYVLDHSDSMNSTFSYQLKDKAAFSITPLVAAKNELLRSLYDLDERQQFRILFYNHNVSPFSLEGNTNINELIPANAKNRLAATEFVNNIHGSGQTNHMPAFESAIKQKPDVIFLMTDGEQKDDPSRDQLARLRSLNNGHAKINVVQFCYQTRSPGTLAQLANENGGKHIYKTIAQLPPVLSASAGVPPSDASAPRTQTELSPKAVGQNEVTPTPPAAK